MCSFEDKRRERNASEAGTVPATTIIVVIVVTINIIIII